MGRVLKATLKSLLGQPKERALQKRGEKKRGKEEDPEQGTQGSLTFVCECLAGSMVCRHMCSWGPHLSITDAVASSVSKSSPLMGPELYLDLSPTGCALPMISLQF